MEPNIEFYNIGTAERNKNTEKATLSLRIFFKKEQLISIPLSIFNYAHVNYGILDVQYLKGEKGAENVKVKFIRAYACKHWILQIRMEIIRFNFISSLSFILPQNYHILQVLAAP
jgi:hypothetical protein